MKKKNRYIIKKFIEANSAKEAISLEKKCDVDEVFVDEKDINKDNPVGFNNKK